jgi:hypothetical protein
MLVQSAVFITKKNLAPDIVRNPAPLILKENACRDRTEISGMHGLQIQFRALCKELVHRLPQCHLYNTGRSAAFFYETACKRLSFRVLLIILRYG